MATEQKVSKRFIFRIFVFARNLMGRLGYEFYVFRRPTSELVPARRYDADLINGSVNWARVPMYQAIKQVLTEQIGASNLIGRRGVEIGGSEGTLARVLTNMGAQLEIAHDYPAVDAERLPYADSSYGLLVADQVIEHLRRPWKAVEEIWRVLSPGGLCICTSVLVYPVHSGFDGGFKDYYRYTVDGIRALFEGFEIVTAGGWGNAEILRLVYERSERGPEGPPPLSKEKLLSKGLYNRSDNMNHLVTWCVARKPAR